MRMKARSNSTIRPHYWKQGGIKASLCGTTDLTDEKRNKERNDVYFRAKVFSTRISKNIYRKNNAHNIVGTDSIQ